MSRIVDLAKRIGYNGPPKRLDHGRMYTCIMFGLFFMSLSMLVVGPVPDSTISNLNYWTQQGLAICILIGASICIGGILRGTKVFKANGDIRISYQIAKWGVPSIAFSLSFYVGAIVFNVGSFWASTLSTSIGISIILGSLWNALDFESETRKLDRKFKGEIEPDNDH